MSQHLIQPYRVTWGTLHPTSPQAVKLSYPKTAAVVYDELAKDMPNVQMWKWSHDDEQWVKVDRL